MAEKYYIDTSIWMDYYEDRTDPSRDIGESAFKLLSKLLASKSTIVVSTFLLRELETAYSLDSIRGLTSPFEKLMEKVDISDKQREEAEKIAEKTTFLVFAGGEGTSCNPRFKRQAFPTAERYL